MQRPRRRHGALALIVAALAVSACSATADTSTTTTSAAGNSASDPGRTQEEITVPATEAFPVGERLVTFNQGTVSSAPLGEIATATVSDVVDTAMAGENNDLVIVLRQHRTEQQGLNPATETWSAQGLDPVTLQSQWTTDLPIAAAKAKRAHPVRLLPLSHSKTAVISDPDANPNSTLGGMLFGLEAATGKIIWTDEKQPVMSPSQDMNRIYPVATDQPDKDTYLLLDSGQPVGINLTDGKTTPITAYKRPTSGKSETPTVAWNQVFYGDQVFDVLTGRRLDPPDWLIGAGPALGDKNRNTWVPSPQITEMPDGTAIAAYLRFFGRVNRDGTVIWHLPSDVVEDAAGKNGSNLQTLKLLGVSDGYLLVDLSTAQQYAALDATNGRQLWSAAKPVGAGADAAQVVDARVSGSSRLRTERVGEYLIRYNPAVGTVTVRNHPGQVYLWDDTQLVPAP